MPDSRLAEMLGQDAVAARLLADLEDEECHLVRLSGGAGSGKSYVARQVAESWRMNGGSCVVAIGDDEHSWKELFPLLSGLAQIPPDWAGLAKTGGRSAIQIGETVVGSPGVGTSIFDLLTAGFRQQTERALKPYSDLARDVILDLKRLARRRPLLLVCDNAHWWDADSLRLLADVISGPIRDAVSQLQSVVVLLVDTAGEQQVMAPGAFEALTSRCAGRTQQMLRCDREQFPAVLEAYGVSGPLPSRVVDELFAATNGHLKLAEQIGRYENPGSLGELASPDRGYVTGLVTARFDSLGASSPEVVNLLAGVAVLGLSCSEQDLLCVANRRRAELRTLVEQAEKIGFVERSAEEIAFSHDVIRSAILREQSTARLEGLYLKLSECLAILRPGNYEDRAQALLQAEEVGPAREMIALAGVAQLRRGVPATKVIRRAELRFPDDAELKDFLQVIADGYTAVAKGDFEAVSGLRAQTAEETPAMAAERNYLAAICLLGLQTDTGRSEARTILTSWAAAVEDEVELELRFLVLLQQAQVLSDMFEKARETEIRIEQRLSKRAQYDVESRVLIQIQHRRSGGVMAPEFAEDRIGRAVSFFTAGTGERRRDQLELFRSLTNLTAIEIRLDSNQKAYAHALEAERIAVESLDVGHRLDVLASNLVLAGYRSGAIDLNKAIENQHLIVHSPEGSGDNFIQRCNLTAYLLLAARDEKASAELKELQQEVREIGIDESYLVYYSGALAVAAAVAGGDLEEAMRRHQEMESFVCSRNWPTASYLQRRQRLLGAVLPTLDPELPRTQLDRVLVDSMPLQVGRAWAYYGRLIPCCELSFWTDS
ncbi:MAG TPA: AAA family ATPase [Solirubrobacterales bacterium]|nr:AAA family ATPase [Solirubrobacterales bacterium]